MQARKREEFKHTVLSSVGLVKEPTEEDKIRQDFKKQILSNLDKKDLPASTNSNATSAKAREEMIKDQFKSQIINNCIVVKNCGKITKSILHVTLKLIDDKTIMLSSMYYFSSHLFRLLII